MNTQPIDVTLAAAGSKATYTGSGIAGFGWLLSSEAGVMFGVVLGVIGYLTNLYFKRRADAREQREHEAYMCRMESGRTPLEPPRSKQ
jgi:hypothetical protein